MEEPLFIIHSWVPLKWDEDHIQSDLPNEMDGKWIIVTDGKNVSVERAKKDAIDHFFPEGRWFNMDETIAWMPLPEIYDGHIMKSPLFIAHSDGTIEQVIEYCEDCISRKASVEAMKKLFKQDCEDYGCEIPECFDADRAIKELKALPPIQPIKPKGG